MSLKSGVPIAPIRFLGVKVYGVERVGSEDGFPVRSVPSEWNSKIRSR